MMKRVIFILKCLMTNLFILCGCYFAFPSDLVHINNIQGDSNTCRGALQSRCWCTMGELLTHSYNIIDAPLNAASTVQSVEKHLSNETKKNIHHATVLPPSTRISMEKGDTSEVYVVWISGAGV